MEGVSGEAASLAGFLKLGKLIYFYDDNHITIEGNTDLTFCEDVGKHTLVMVVHTNKIAQKRTANHSVPKKSYLPSATLAGRPKSLSTSQKRSLLTSDRLLSVARNWKGPGRNNTTLTRLLILNWRHSGSEN